LIATLGKPKLGALKSYKRVAVHCQACVLFPILILFKCNIKNILLPVWFKSLE